MVHVLHLVAALIGARGANIVTNWGDDQDTPPVGSRLAGRTREFWRHRLRAGRRLVLQRRWWPQTTSTRFSRCWFLRPLLGWAIGRFLGPKPMVVWRRTPNPPAVRHQLPRRDGKTCYPSRSSKAWSYGTCDLADSEKTAAQERNGCDLFDRHDRLGHRAHHYSHFLLGTGVPQRLRWRSIAGICRAAAGSATLIWHWLVAEAQDAESRATRPISPRNPVTS